MYRIERGFMRKLLTPAFVILLGAAIFCPRPAMALRFSAPTPKFNYTDSSGKKQSVEVVDKYYPKKITQPIAKVDRQHRSEIAPGRHHRRGARTCALA